MSLPVNIDSRLARIDSEARQPHNRLLLACAGPCDSRDATAAADTNTVIATILRRGGVSWEDLVGASMRHGVFPMVSARLLLPSHADSLPPDVRGCLRRLLSASRDRNAVMLAETAKLVEALRQAGIRSIVLKGAALSITAYPDPGMRNFADIDILVDPENYVAAAEVLNGAGYAPERTVNCDSLTQACVGKAEADILSDTLAPEFVPGHAPHLVAPFLQSVVVELHRGLMRTLDGCWRRADLDPFWDSARPFCPTPSGTAASLGPEAMLVHLAIHASEHAFAKLMFPIDAAQVVRRASSGLSWDRAAGIARSCDAGDALYQLLHLSRSLCGAEVPEEGLAALRAACPRSPRLLRASAVLANRPTVGTGVRLSRLLAARSLTVQLRSAARILALPVATMREVYGVRSLPIVWCFYLFRPFHLAGRAARIVVQNAIASRP